MSLRTRSVLFLVITYLLLGAAAWLLFRENPWWLYPAELILAVLLVVGVSTFRSLARPNELLTTGAELLSDSDYSSTLRETGVEEFDRIVHVYNRMLEQLREERLRAEEQRSFLEKLLELAPVGVVTLDLDGRIDRINPAATRLLDAAEPNEDRGGVRPSHLTEEELRNIPLATSTLISLQRRRLRLWRGEFLDRGFRRTFYMIEELTAELQESQRTAYGKAIRMMSHEINNSIGSVRSLLESMARLSPQLLPPEREKFDEAIEVATRRLGNLADFTRGVADVIRIPPPRVEKFDLVSLLNDLAALLRPQLASLRIRLVLRADERLDVEADKNQIEQVIVNVVRNATEAIGRDGEIRIDAERKERRAVLTVRDSGEGIAPEVLPQLFSPFFSTRRDGRGIGLMLIQEILTAHAADFALRNHPAGGAEFVMEL